MNWSKAFDLILMVIKMLIEQREKEIAEAGTPVGSAAATSDPTLTGLRSLEAEAEAAKNAC